MPIDPVAKMAKLRAREADRKLKSRKPIARRGKAVSNAERKRVSELIAAHVLKSTPDNEVIDKIATSLQRSPRTIASIVSDARDKFAAKALDYVDAHEKSLRKALAIGEVGEARKAAEWAIERISAIDDRSDSTSKGSTIRIIEKSSDTPDLPQINIGIALGGLPSRSSIADRLLNNLPHDLPPATTRPIGTIDAEPIDPD